MSVAPIFHEPPLRAAVRFVVEVAAWIAIYFAWGLIPMILAVGALTLFTVPGDKHLVLVAVPGPLRVLLEAVIFGLGVFAAAEAFGPLAAVVLLAGFLVTVALTHRRWLWMWRRGRAA